MYCLKYLSELSLGCIGLSREMTLHVVLLLLERLGGLSLLASHGILGLGLRQVLEVLHLGMGSESMRWTYRIP